MMRPDAEAGDARAITIAEGAVLLRGLASAEEASLLAEVEAIAARAPFRHMETPGGFRMAVALTGCGAAGWISDRQGYRYDRADPLTGRPWPAMPRLFADLAGRAASAAGFPAFAPDSCLINRYLPGTGLSLHQDKNERDFGQPIVSVSLGRPAIFLFGGPKRSIRPRRMALESGDVVVWGGPARLAFHGVAPLERGHDLFAAEARINLTFRKAL